MGKFDGILLLSDMDGTIARDGIISKENKEAVEYFKQNGGLFTYATGRMPKFIAKSELSANAPVIAINGTLIYDAATGETLKKFTLPADTAEIAKKVTEYAHPSCIDICTGTERIHFFNPSSSDFDGFNQTIHKILFVFDSEDETLSVKRTLSKKYAHLDFERSWSTGLELRSGTSGKGVCLKLLKQMTGARLAVAAGDYENDLSMIAEADIGYAPADALLSVREAADRITVPFKQNVIASIIRELEQEMR